MFSNRLRNVPFSYMLMHAWLVHIHTTHTSECARASGRDTNDRLVYSRTRHNFQCTQFWCLRRNGQQNRWHNRVRTKHHFFLVFVVVGSGSDDGGGSGGGGDDGCCYRCSPIAGKVAFCTVCRWRMCMSCSHISLFRVTFVISIINMTKKNLLSKTTKYTPDTFGECVFF